MKRKKNNPRTGSMLEVRAEGQYEKCQTDAIKKVVAYKLSEAMEETTCMRSRLTDKSFHRHGRFRKVFQDALIFCNQGGAKMLSDGHIFTIVGGTV